MRLRLGVGAAMVAIREASADPSTSEFRRQLKTLREERRWSQERLADQAGMDHSLVSRLEGGQRTPTRDAVEKLARGLELLADGKDRLLIAAGYFPDHAESVLFDEPAVRRLYAVLRDTETPEPIRNNIRQVISGLLSIAVAS